MAHEPEWAAGRQLVSGVDGRTKSPGSEVDQRPAHETRARNDQQRAHDSLTRKPIGYAVGHAGREGSADRQRRIKRARCRTQGS